jgi:hypothetical protein
MNPDQVISMFVLTGVFFLTLFSIDAWWKNHGQTHL